MFAFVSDWMDCFKTKSPNDVALACRYVGGLLSQTRRKNMERMDERLGTDKELGVDAYQATQQFIADSPWDDTEVYARIAQRANERLGGSRNAVLCIDESSFAKKGTASVGVSRQWNGRLGKEDNCQTGVFSALCYGQHVCLTGTRLFLPKEWIDKPERCELAGVPEERVAQGLLTKIDLAQELIEEAIENGLEFGCVAMDAFYGRDAKLRRFIEECELIYCVDVPANTNVFEKKPESEERPSPITKHTIRVDALATKVMADKKILRQIIKVREGDNGPVEAAVKAIRVWEWSASTPEPIELWMIIRDMPDGTLKISFCNASAKATLKQLAKWQAARFWVERCFQDAKSHCGMGQYQARGWLAWHHHMALVALAVLFGMQERMSGELCGPDLTMADIEELMEWALIRRPTQEQLLGRIERRHRKRRAAANSKAANRASRRSKRT